MPRACCMCDYRGTRNQVVSHLGKKHPVGGVLSRGRHGRPPKEACDLCGYIHDDIARPGWAVRRGYMTRPKMATFRGKPPPGAKNETFQLASYRIPKHVTRIKGFWVQATGPMKFHITISEPDGRLAQTITLDYPGGTPVYEEPQGDSAVEPGRGKD